MKRETTDAELIERIVREVVRRLGERGVAVQSEAAAGGSELVLTDRVVSLQSIRGRLAGTTRLVVTRTAVVTPAVRDELKENGIELIRR